MQIGLAACRVGQSLRLGGILEKLGRKHVDYGATLETYGVVKDAFMWVIDKALGECRPALLASIKWLFLVQSTRHRISACFAA
jgi:hemoglobin-like flavoprotein